MVLPGTCPDTDETSTWSPGPSDSEASRRACGRALVTVVAAVPGSAALATSGVSKAPGKPFVALLAWLVESHAITQEQNERVSDVYAHRHDLTHELPEYIVFPEHEPGYALLRAFARTSRSPCTEAHTAHHRFGVPSTASLTVPRTLSACSVASIRNACRSFMTRIVAGPTGAPGVDRTGPLGASGVRPSAACRRPAQAPLRSFPPEVTREHLVHASEIGVGGG